RALLLQRPARAAHLGARQRARAPGRADLRQLRPGAGPHPHPPRARPPRRAAVLPGERRLPRDAPSPPGRHPRPRRADRLPFPNLPRGRGALPVAPAGAGLGEGQPSAPAPGQRGAGAQAQSRSRRPAALKQARLRHLRRLLPYLARHRRGMGVGLFALLVRTALSVASPWVLRHAVDDLTLGVTRGKLWTYAVLIVAIVAAEALFLYWMRQVLIGISREIEFELRNDLYGHLTVLPARYYQAHRTGDLMSRATNDLSAVRMV